MQVPTTSDETVSIAAWSTVDTDGRAWPELKELFIKLNTPLPASAAAKRLTDTELLLLYSHIGINFTCNDYLSTGFEIYPKISVFFHSNSKNRKNN